MSPAIAPRLLAPPSYGDLFTHNWAQTRRFRPAIRDIRSWASRRTSPTEILAKYGARGYTHGCRWAYLLAEVAYAPDARYLFAYAVAKYIERGNRLISEHADLVVRAGCVEVPGGGEWSPASRLSFAE